MFVIKRYKFGFDVWGLLLFLIIMIPNFIWFGVEAPNDWLRQESVTPTIDAIASVIQVVMIVTLCIIKNSGADRKIDKRGLFGITSAVSLYFIGWIVYYTGVVNAIVILDLCIAPCVAFILFSAKRKNVFALVLASAFTVCHVTYSIINFII